METLLINIDQFESHHQIHMVHNSFTPKNLQWTVPVFELEGLK